MYFKDLTRAEKKHLEEFGGVRTLRAFRAMAEKQAEWRKEGAPEPCWECRRIAAKLGLPV
jgi:hypothetical protein